MSFDPAAWPARGLSAKLLGVDGRGGSGKSTLAALLARRLGASVVHMDDFASWDNPSDWWPLVMSHVMKPLSDGATSLSYPLSSWDPDPAVSRPPVTGQPVTPVMILEGVSALRAEFRPYLSFGIFVEVPRSVAIARGVARDLGYGQLPPAEVERNWSEWAAAEDAYLARDRPDVFADLVLDGTADFAPMFS